ncbi:AAA family ATPase [Methylomagnum sp.]
MEFILFIGIQATGKSSFYRARFADTHIRLNLDMLRTRHRERILFNACLTAKQRVVVDNTNPTRADRAVYISAALDAGFTVVGYFFESRMQDTLRRNAQRPDPQRIPEKGVRGASARLELPSLSEGFHRLFLVRLIEATHDFEIKDWCHEI